MKIIFLHNRKTAGTSFRVMMTDLVGLDNLYWKHNALTEEDVDVISEKLVVGGHFDIENVLSHMQITDKDVFLSCMREPFDRIVSLFNHHRTKDNWAAKKIDGFNSDSLEDTVFNCDKFRNLIRNEQCFVISGSRDCNTAIQVLKKRPFIIGTSEHSDNFIQEVSKILNTGHLSLPNSNRAVGDKMKGSNISDRLKIELESLIGEDVKLYKFISSCGVYSSVDNRVEKFQEYYSNKNKGITSDVRSKIALESPYKSITVDKKKEFLIPVKIINNSSVDLYTKKDDKIFISYHLYTLAGELIEWDGLRSNLPDVIKAGGSSNVNVRIPKYHPRLDSYKVLVGLLHETVSWFESDNPNHEIPINIKLD